jgi:hypothetical protein
LPTYLTTIGNYFLESAFYNCQNLYQLNHNLYFSNIDDTNLRNYFLYNTFYNCVNLKFLPFAFNLDFGGKDYVKGNNNFIYTFKNCTSLMRTSILANETALYCPSVGTGNFGFECFMGDSQLQGVDNPTNDTFTGGTIKWYIRRG